MGGLLSELAKERVEKAGREVMVAKEEAASRKIVMGWLCHDE